MNPQERGVTELETLREQLKDMTYLPTYQEACDAFPPERDPSWNEEYPPWKKLRYSLKNPGSGSAVPLFYEFLTREYVVAMAEYLSGRAALLGKESGKQVTIAEVGAGDGRLAHFIKAKIGGSTGIDYVATDSGKWNISPTFPDEHVERMDYKATLQKYQPSIVISSWMRFDNDWTRAFRASKSVQEYILIGMPELCGQPWLTWGDRFFGDEPDNLSPSYVLGGFNMQNLSHLERYQICNMDSAPSLNNHSKTVSFRRVAIPPKNNLPSVRARSR